MRGTVRKASDVLGPILADHEDIMLPVASSTRCAFRHPKHGFHRNNHAWLQNSLDVFPQFKAGLAPVIVRKHAEGVTVAEGAIVEQPLLMEKAVDFGADFVAPGAGFD